MEIKKQPKKDLRRKTTMFFQVGLAVSLGLMLGAFEYYIMKEEPLKRKLETMVDETATIPPIKQPPPPPPPPDEVPQELPPEIKKVDDEKETKPFVPKQDSIKNIKPKQAPPPQEDLGGEIFTVVEKMPEFPGGQEALDKYVQFNFKMPPEAAEVGAAGKIYIEFVVDIHGKVSDIKILKDGVGWGCGEEALRVVKMMAKEFTWSPGEQRNKKVPVRYRYPIVINQR